MSPLKRHLLAFAGIVAVGVPVLVADLLLLGPTGSGWAAMDFRGMLIGLYGACALLFWIASGIVAFAIRPRTLGCLGYAGVATATMSILCGGVGAYYGIEDLALRRQVAVEEDALLEEGRQIGPGVLLERWSIDEREAVLTLRSTEQRALCSWDVRGFAAEEYRQDVYVEDVIEYTCGDLGPHAVLPEGTSELRGPVRFGEEGSLETVDRWRVEVWIEGHAGTTSLIWETGAGEEIYAGTYTRALPSPTE